MNDLLNNPLKYGRDVLGDVRFVLILWVLAVHVLDFYPEHDNCIISFIRESVLRSDKTIFFVISGFFFFQNVESFNREIYTRKLKSRFFTLLLPYLIWNMVAWLFIISTRTTIQGAQQLDDFLSWNAPLKVFWSYDGGLPAYYPFWFIKYLIVISILTPVINFFVKRLKWAFPLGAILLNIASVCAGGPNVTMLYYIGCFSFGAYLGLYPNSIRFFEQMRWWPVVILTSIADSIYFGSEYYDPIHLVNMAVETLVFIKMFFVLKKFKPSPWLPGLKQYTFVIFASHALFVPALYSVFNDLLGVELPVCRLASSLCVYAATLLSSILLGYVMKGILPSVYKYSVGGR